MFEVRCIVADKKLSQVLRSLNGLTLEPPVTLSVDQQPVVAKKNSAGELLDHITKIKPGTEFTTQDIKTEAAKRGITKDVAVYVLSRAKLLKLVKSIGRGSYKRIGS